MRAGTLLMTWVGMAFLSRTVPELEAVSLPFLFPSREVGLQGDGRPDRRRCSTRSSPTRASSRSASWNSARARSPTAVRPIKTIADLKGLKIRLQPNETHLATFRALGANPVAMDIREVYSAMEQKVIDGHENPYALILDQPLLRGAEVRLQHRALLRLHRRGGQPQEVRGADARHPEGDPHGDGQRRRRRSAPPPPRPTRRRWPSCRRRACSTTPCRRPSAKQMRKVTAGVVDDIKKRVGAGPGRPRAGRSAEGPADGKSTGAADDRAGARRAALRPVRAALLGGLDTVAGWAIVACISVMVTVVSLQVLLRYVLNSSHRLGRRGLAPARSSGRSSSASRWASAPASHIGMELLSRALAAARCATSSCALMAAIAAA